MNLVPNILGGLAVAAALLFARVRADDEVTLRLKGKGFSYSWAYIQTGGCDRLTNCLTD